VFRDRRRSAREGEMADATDVPDVPKRQAEAADSIVDEEKV
jgi:hypothetical protein